MRVTHTRMQLAMSCIGGLMLGVALLHLLPHSVHATASVDRSVGMATIGLLTMFFLIRTFHVHPHMPEEAPDAQCSHGLPHVHGSEHDHHDHDHHHKHDDQATSPLAHRFSWLGLAIGLSLHTIIDGMALAASVKADALHGASGLMGAGTFCAVFFHKPLDALSISTVMSAAHWSKGWIILAIVTFSLMCPIGAFLFLAGVNELPKEEYVVGLALAFSAGVFLCISLSDLLPEVQFHSHDRLMLSAALLLGVVFAYLITFIEPQHLHHG